MDFNEMKTKSVSELNQHLLDLRREQFGLRMQRSQGQLTQTHQINKVRKEVARLKTVLAVKAKG
jgi:large subunit ribosomal protein L29